MPSAAKRCQGRRQDGALCQSPAVAATGYCFAHDPEAEAARQDARQAGGRNSAKAVRLRGLMPPRLVPVYDTLETVLDEVHTGTCSPQQAHAMAAVARVMVTVLTSGELEERVRHLETKADP